MRVLTITLKGRHAPHDIDVESARVCSQHEHGVNATRLLAQHQPGIFAVVLDLNLKLIEALMSLV